MFRMEPINYIRYDSEVDVHSNVKRLENSIENIIIKNTFKKTIKERNMINKWFNADLRMLKLQKVHKYQLARFTNTRECWNEYRNARNKYKVKIQNEKNKYINNKINQATNQKQMWKEIKTLVLKKNNNVIQSVIFNHGEYKNNKEIASQFNQYFIESIQTIRQSIGNVQYINKIPLTNHKFKFRAISIDELKNICIGMKNKNDFNKIKPRMITDNWKLMGPMLLQIINKSLMSGVFPTSWKESMITPIEKVAKTKKCEEFRPINSLKTFEKILEKAVKYQLEQYMEEHNLFSKYQSGFRKKFSCETTVNFVINKWKGTGEKKKIMAMFLDFKRAFETIDRDILIEKLYMYGIQDKELEWFKSYLTQRTQRTRVNNITSDYLEIEYGVPQGAILGALLFIIYINDMPKVLEKCEIVLYADDTMIYAEGCDSETCKTNIMHDIENINIWLKTNKLKLNEKKTKFMEVNMISEEMIQINGENIEKVTHIKYLGFMIDNELKFRQHTEYICKKIGKKIGFFRRIRNKISTMTAINIYNTIIKPHFEYGSTILFSCCNQSQVERLQKLQNKAMRIILKCSRYEAIRNMLSTLRWMSIQQRLELNTLVFIQKMKQGNAPSYLTENIRYVSDIQPYGLRNSNDFRMQRRTTTGAQNSLFYKGLRLFNMLPINIKNEVNLMNFKRKCIEFVKNKPIL